MATSSVEFMRHSSVQIRGGAPDYQNYLCSCNNVGQVQEKLSGIFAETDRVITDYFRAAQEVGRLPGGHEPQALARMVIAVTHSIATRARAGGSRKQLSVMVDDFMALLFPG